MNTKDKYWLAGLLEGEGSFMVGPPSDKHIPVVSLQMTDQDVVQRVADLFGVTIYYKSSNNVKHKDCWTTRLKGQRAVEVMKEILPLMGQRRQSQIKRAVESYKPAYRNLTEKIVSKIKSELDKGNLTQSQIAKKYGFRRETICRINRGKTGSSPVGHPKFLKGFPGDSRSIIGIP